MGMGSHGVMGMLSNQRWGLYNFANALNATESYMLKWLIWYVNFTSIRCICQLPT